jgi:signal transduction histidine kinase
MRRTSLPTSPSVSRPAAEIDQQLDALAHLASLGEITAMLAHEMNNLLTPLVSYAQAGLAAGNDAAFREKALAKCLLHAEQASRVSRAVLGLAKGGGLDGDSVAGSCDVIGAIDAALTTMGRDLSKDGIELLVDVKEPLNAALAPAALQQIILNLVLNAHRAIIDQPGRVGGSIELRARRRERGGGGGADGLGWVVIKVRDTGPGADVPRMLEALGPGAYIRKQSDGQAELAIRGAGGASGGGAGFGLRLVRRMVEMVGGTMTVRTGDEGTAVAVVLPRGE